MSQNNAQPEKGLTQYAKFLPEKLACYRAIVAAIPMVGGSLDHLLFDKADSIKFKNLELSFDALSQKFLTFEENSINKDWFESEEALATIKILIDKISFEPNKNKIKTLGSVIATFGLTENSSDKHKLSILNHLGGLSDSQIELLKIISLVKRRERKISSSTGVTVTTSGLWFTDIFMKIRETKETLLGTYMLDIEILESHNTIRKINLPISDNEGGGYRLTEIGKLAAAYLKKADE